MTEAPLGALWHRYEIGADGLIKNARIVPPTSQNQAAIEADLDHEWGVLGEAIQTVMRRYGFDQPYERLKSLTRGTTITEDDVHAFVTGLGLPADAEKRLLALTPATYVGLAGLLARLDSET